MIKNIMRGIFALIGFLIGYGVCQLAYSIAGKVGYNIDTLLSSRNQFIIALIIALIFCFIFFKTGPAFGRLSMRLASGIGSDIQNVPGNVIASGTIGLIAGLVIAALITQLFMGLGFNRYLKALLLIAIYAGLGYFGVVVGASKGSEIMSNMAAARKQQESSSPRSSRSRRKSGQIPKILDTSVIIDGRIADIMKTGFIEGPIIIPEFVLVELRHIADSSDSLKRARGRQGLDILKKIQTDYGVDIYNTNKEKALKEIPEVDVKLLKLAEIMNGKVVTNDYNLNKVAGINGVSVLNINELANCLKPVVLPGEQMTLHLVKPGKDPEQAIGYLNDGTMIVVEDGRDRIGDTTDIRVTSVLQTAAGRMIFGRLKK